MDIIPKTHLSNLSVEFLRILAELHARIFKTIFKRPERVISVDCFKDRQNYMRGFFFNFLETIIPRSMDF